MSYFIITVDTEGDNQWDTSNGISTKNVAFLPRFQDLCEKYGFKPVWLTNYEMANDDNYVNFFKRKQNENKCEIGMHLHAWYTPPHYNLNRVTDYRDYLIEYPLDIMNAKIDTMTKLLTTKFEEQPISHRSGRWAMNDAYFKMLVDFGYRVDCSVTPHISWEKNLGATGIGGTNYTNYPELPYFTKENILEVPVSIRKMNFIDYKRIHGIYSGLKEIKHAVEGKMQWLRFLDTESEYGVCKLTDKIINEANDAMFMIHSSELMPGGSPIFSDEQAIEQLYLSMDIIFRRFAENNYRGCTLKEYYKNKISKE